MRDVFDALKSAAAVVAERRRVILAAQLDEELVFWLVLEPFDVLHGEGLHGLEFAGG